MATPVGLTAKGLIIPTLEQLRSDVSADLKENVSTSLNTEGDSLLGNIDGIFLAKLHRAWEELLNVYNSGHPDTASGVPLAYLSALTGTVVRKPSKGTVTASVELEAGATLPIGSGASSEDDPTMQFVTTEVVNNSGGGTAFFDVEMETTEVGSRIFANAGKLTVIDTPEVGWLSVTNAADSALGRDEEKDPDLRFRRESELGTPGTGTSPAIRADLQQLIGVQNVQVFANNKDYVDENGVPPHAIEILILEDGSLTDQQLFNAIFLSLPAGKRTFGTATGTVSDSAGNSQPIAFSRPTVIEAYVTMNILVDPVLYDQTATITALGEWEDGLRLGEDIYASDMINVVADQPGVEKVEVSTVRVDRVTPPVTVDMAVAPREIGNIDTANITITANVI